MTREFSKTNSTQTMPTKSGAFSGESGKVKKNGKVTPEEYRKIIVDWTSNDAEIQKRLDYLYSFCRNVIRSELEKHAKKGREKR